MDEFERTVQLHPNAAALKFEHTIVVVQYAHEAIEPERWSQQTNPILSDPCGMPKHLKVAVEPCHGRS